ncbi:MAG: response regulator transcription factor [Clostridiaceae bacterium]
MIRVLLADDQALMADGLKTIIDLEEDMEVVATAGDGKTACELARRLRPDIALLDIRMPVMDGVESARMIKRDCPEIIVIMLTTFNDEEYIIRALSYGASGYLLKDIQADLLLKTIRNSASGNLFMMAPVAAKLSSGLSSICMSSGPSCMKTLDFSDREKEIAGLIEKGMSNRQIASSLYLSEGTVKNYISGIYEKIGVNDRGKAVLELRKYMERYKDGDKASSEGND